MTGASHAVGKGSRAHRMDRVAWIRRSRAYPGSSARAPGLADAVHDIAEPLFRRIEMLAALDAREFDGAQLAVLVLVMAGDTRNLVEGAFDSEIDHALDQAQVVAIGRSRA